ncbi:MAG TPA: hypothetical protein VM219_02880 [Phycisphaerae bacterium]|nr:hypothetical protein [Phycisphaerae bacterium]
MNSYRILLAVGVAGVLVGVVAVAVAAQAEDATTLLREAEKLHKLHKYDAALKRLDRIDRDTLGFWDKGKHDSLLEKSRKAVEAKAADQGAFVQGKEALEEGRLATAVEQLKSAANSPYLDERERDQAKGLLQVAEQRHRGAQEKAKALLDRAKGALAGGRTEEARDRVKEVRSMDVNLGWFERTALSGLEKKLAQAPAPEAPAEEAAVAEEEAEMAPVVVAEETEPAEEARAEEPLVEAPKEAAERRTLAQQARRAEAEEEIRLGEMALADHEYTKAKIHFTRAMDLWPQNERARQGRDEAMKRLAEREEPVIGRIRTSRDIERQRITANVQELLAESERARRKAETPDQLNEALRPLAHADRQIDLARVLSPEEAERLREEVYVMRRQVLAQKEEAEVLRRRRAEAEAADAEADRIRQYEIEQQRKVQQLWERTTELRRSMQFAPAIQVLDRLIAIDPLDERARLWRDDLLYLESQARQVDLRKVRKTGAVEAMADLEEAATHPGEEVNGVKTFLRYPQPKTWKELTDFRREFTRVVSAEPEAVAETRRLLQEKIDLDFEHTSLDNVLRFISEVERGLNIVPDPDLQVQGIDLSTRVVDLKVKGVSVEEVMNLILGAELGYKVEAGYILVTTREKLQQNLPIVTYPVQDLVARIPDFSGMAPRFDPGDITQAAAGGVAGGGGFGELFGAGAAAEEEEVIGPDELMDIVKRNVNNMSDPDVAAWTDEGGPAAIDYMNGLLVTTQTRRGHERIADLLEMLRRERAIMISVEARFVRVTDEFLQDITLDVDVALPSSHHFDPAGNAVVDPGAVASGSAYGTLPGIATTQYGQPIVVSSTGSNGLGTSTLLSLAGTSFADFTASEGGLAVSGVFLDSVQVGFLLRAIQADVRSTMLFAPRITLYNGQRAYIAVAQVESYIADAEPVVSEYAVGWNPMIGSLPSGSTLDVKATVSADRRYVQLDLRPQVADIIRFDTTVVEAYAAGAASPAQITIDLPVVAVQEVMTTVSVPDGGTLLLGGSKRFTETEAETGVPLLSKVPILKRLFSNRASLRYARNLLILIRPKIIIQAEEEHRLGYDNF